MTIVANFEGPKGVGKSTILRELLKRGYAHKIQDFNGNWDHLITDDQVNKDRNSALKIMYDRGVLSHFVYTFVMSADPDFDRVRYNGSKIEIQTWRTPNIGMIEELLNQIDGKMYIMYASNVSILKDRIYQRHQTSGKGATDEEMKVLTMSNLLYKQIGEFLKFVFPDKIELIEVDELTTIDDIIERVIS